MCADGDPADVQTEEGEEMEKNSQAGTGGRCRAKITVSHAALSPILCGSARPWTTELLGVSNRPGDRLETTADRRLGVCPLHSFGQALTIGQDRRMETGVYLRYQRPFLVPKLRR